MAVTWEIVEGDCLEVMRAREADSVDLIATDPPYFKVANEPWDHQWDNPAEFLKWIGLLCAEWQRILKPNGSLYMFASPQMAGRVECAIRERMNVLNQIIWNKGITRSGAGSGIDVSAIRKFWPAHESIVFAEQYGADSTAKGEAGYTAACNDLHCKVYGRVFGDYLAAEIERSGVTRKEIAALFPSRTGGLTGCLSNWTLGHNCPSREQYEAIRDLLNSHGRDDYLRREYEDLRREYEDLRRPFNVTADVEWGDVWTFNPPKSRSHPCEKPLAMMRHIIKASSRPDAVVLDCFLGSGATAEAAINEGRNFIGIEINPEYAAIARERCAKAERQPDLFIKPPKPEQGSLL